MLHEMKSIHPKQAPVESAPQAKQVPLPESAPRPAVPEVSLEPEDRARAPEDRLAKLHRQEELQELLLQVERPEPMTPPEGLLLEEKGAEPAGVQAPLEMLEVEESPQEEAQERPGQGALLEIPQGALRVRAVQEEPQGKGAPRELPDRGVREEPQGKAALAVLLDQEAPEAVQEKVEQEEP
jgi:hypothetical protein